MQAKYAGRRPEGVSYQGADALSVGREYAVLEISSLADRPSYFRIEVVNGEPPALFDVRLFEVTSPAIPPNWMCSLDESGLLTIGPKAWREIDFWEAYLERREWAVAVYEREREAILSARTE